MRKSFFKSLIADRKGSVTVLSALALPVVIGLVALVTEYGFSLLTKVENQRVADAAAYAGALAYNATSSTTTMNAVIANVGALDGVASANISGALVASPTGDGNQAVQVTINSVQPLPLVSAIGGLGTVTVKSSAYAELKANTQGCIVALSQAGTGVTLSGGTSVSAASCAIASDATVTVPCGTTISTIGVNYDSASAPSQPCSGITAPSGKTLRITNTLTADPVAGNAGVTAATAHIASVAAIASPSNPGVSSGGDVNFAYSTASTQSQLATDGCSGTFSSNTWTVTCSGNGPFHFGNITTGGGITVNFNTGGSASAVYDFSGSINNTGTAMTFGPGTFNINGGIITGGGTATTFGAGTFNIGSSAGSCNGSTGYSICHSGSTLTFGGPSAFTMQGAIYNSGGEKIVFGSGNSNSFTIGKASDGNSFVAGGGSTTTFADATGVGDVFQMAGNLNVSSGGGSCLTLSAATQHDINGNFVTAGGTILGSGVYTVNGYIGLGTNGGGDVTCGGVSVGMSGTGVTLVTSAAHTIPSGTCAGQSFCVAAGYGNVTLTAPTSGTTANLVVIGPTNGSTAGASFAEGASNTSLSGVFYFPTGPVTLSGGSSVGNGTGQCLEFVGSQISLTGGTALASSCLSGSSSSSTVVLVQ
jgi:Flp pilus assembly protein TadG